MTEKEIDKKLKCMVDQAAFYRHCMIEGNYLFNLATSVYWIVGSTHNPNYRNRKMQVTPLHLVQAQYQQLLIELENECLMASKVDQQPDDAEDNQKPYPTGFDPELLGIPIDPVHCLEMAKVDTNYSKNLVRYLQDSPALEDIEFLYSLIEADLAACINSKNACYIVKYAMKVNVTIRSSASKFCSAKIHLMLQHQHTSRLVFALCSFSQEFRKNLLKMCETQYIHLIQTLPGAILISSLITYTEDIKDCRLILDQMLIEPELVKQRFIGRAFTAYMNRCSIEELDQILTLIQKSINSILHDNYGNYLLQAFYNRNHKAGISMCEYALKKVAKRAYLRKYCRYVLLKAVVNDQDS